jgi:hypothetical protein
MESEIKGTVNEILDNDIMRQCSSCDSDDNYTQLVTHGTHKDCDSVNDGDELTTVTHD